MKSVKACCSPALPYSGCMDHRSGQKDEDSQQMLYTSQQQHFSYFESHVHRILVQNNRGETVLGEEGSARCLGEMKQQLCMD